LSTKKGFEKDVIYLQTLACTQLQLDTFLFGPRENPVALNQVVIFSGQVFIFDNK